MPYVTSIERNGIKKGRQEGRQEGLQEGMQKEAQTTLLRILNRRFGQVPAEIEI